MRYIVLSICYFLAIIYPQRKGYIKGNHRRVLSSLLCLVSCLPLLVILVALPGLAADEAEVGKLRGAEWKVAFSDDCAGHWRDQWFLDGIHAKVANPDKRMTMDTADGYAVLWTKQSFVGSECGLSTNFGVMARQTKL